MARFPAAVPPQRTAALLPAVQLLMSSSAGGLRSVVVVGAWSLSSLLYGDAGASSDSDSDSDAGKASPSSAALAKKRTKKSANPPPRGLPSVLSRDLDASVSVLSWPTTLLSPMCEAWAFLVSGPSSSEEEESSRSDEDEARRYYEKWKWLFLDELVDAFVSSSIGGGSDPASARVLAELDAAHAGGGGSSNTKYADSVEAAAGAAARSYRWRLVRLDLALCSHSPLYELHSALARDAALVSGLYDPTSSASLPGAFGASYPEGLVGTDPAALVESLRRSLGGGGGGGGAEDAGGTSESSPLLPGKLRQYYQQLLADPDSLANLDQDLPNYAQHDVPIFSLPQEWLWCKSWCSDETKAAAKTIDLCNNPLHKEPKVSMAKHIISGELFEESWIELDAEVQKYEDEYRALHLGFQEGAGAAPVQYSVAAWIMWLGTGWGFNFMIK